MTREEIMRVRAKWKALMLRGDLAPEWQNFNTFLRWADENGYTTGKAIRKTDKKRPYGPNNWKLYDINMVQRPSKGQEETDGCTAEAWDRTVTWFLERLSEASPQQIKHLVRKIADGGMPAAWYAKK